MTFNASHQDQEVLAALDNHATMLYLSVMPEYLSKEEMLIKLLKLTKTCNVCVSAIKKYPNNQ